MFYNKYPNRKDRHHKNRSYCYNSRTYQHRRELEATRIELRAYRDGLLDYNERDKAYFDECYSIVLENLRNTYTNAQWN